MHAVRSLSILGLLAAGLVGGASQAATPAWYKITELAFFPEGNIVSTEAYAINNAGQVVGDTFASTKNPQYGGPIRLATLWSGDKVINLHISGAITSSARGINNQGQVVGYTTSAFDVNQEDSVHAVLWTSGASSPYVQLGVNSQGLNSMARGINDAGQIVGDVYPDTSNTTKASQATLWRSASPTALGNLLTNTHANAINQGGQVVGNADNFVSASPSWQEAATLWNGTTPTQLGTGTAAAEAALAVNDAGQAVGYSKAVGDTSAHATLWRSGTATALLGLGGSGSQANAINQLGQAVGWAMPKTGTLTHATLWDGNTVIDLNTYLDIDRAKAGWVVTEARGINDQGVILVQLVNSSSNWQRRAALMTAADKPLPTCSATYKVTNSNLLTFSVQVTLSNLSSAALSGWSVNWVSTPRPYLLATKNVKLSVTGTAVSAQPLTANPTIAAKASTVFTFTSLKGKAVPGVSDLTAMMGGKYCDTAVTP